MSSEATIRGPQNAGKMASWLSLIGRMGAGQVFIFAGLLKLGDPNAFAGAITTFEALGEGSLIYTMVQQETLVRIATFIIPWTEVIAGLLLVAGLFTRASATVLMLMLAGFIGLILAVVSKELHIECGCFGDLSLFCEAKLSNCNLIQNGVLAGLVLLPLVLGGGRASADALGSRPAAAFDESEYDLEDEDEIFD